METTSSDSNANTLLAEPLHHPPRPPPSTQYIHQEATTPMESHEVIAQKRHGMEVWALGWAVFTNGYLCASVYAYSGYWALETGHATTETAGYTSSWLINLYWLGQALSWHSWKLAADQYGRRTVLLCSLFLSLVFSLLFGWTSQNFTLALVWRFCLGLGNGIMATVKIVTSEIANGDDALETKGLSVVASIWGWSLLISTVLSGSMTLVTRQYSEYWKDYDSGVWYHWLDDHPFFLPNLLAVLLCIWSLLAVNDLVYETLSTQQYRNPKHIPRDLFTRLKSMLSTIQEEEGDGLLSKSNSLLYASSAQSKSDYGSTHSPFASPVMRSPLASPRSSGISPSFSRNNQSDRTSWQAAKNDLEHVLHSAILSYQEETTFLAITNVQTFRHHPLRQYTRQESTLASVLAKEFKDNIQEFNDHDVNNSEDQQDKSSLAIMGAYMTQSTARNHILAYWIVTSALSAVEEAFPLLLLSKQVGLGLSVTSIGGVLSAVGALILIFQFTLYHQMIQHHGFYKSMQMASLGMCLFIVLIPGLILLYDLGNVQKLEGLILGSVMLYSLPFVAFSRIFGLVSTSCLLVSLNHSVLPNDRQTLNDACAMSGCLAKAIGARVGGCLVASLLSLETISPALSSFLVFALLSGYSLIASLWTWMLSRGHSPRQKTRESSANKQTLARRSAKASIGGEH